MSRPAGRCRARAADAALAAAATRLAYAVLTSRPPGGAGRWTRTNHRGEPVTLLSGAATVIGAVAGAAVAPGLDRSRRAALVVAGTGAAVFGGYDDLAGDGASRGFRGHFDALRQGKVTTGAVKLAGIGATGVVAAVLAGHGPAGTSRVRIGPDRAGAIADGLINAGLVAGSANLINLFDLRPGRAIKVAIGAGGLLGAAAVPTLAASAALLPEDLDERAMLGDAGANAIGAMLGVAATGLPRRARLGALAAIVGLTAASEVVSFTKVIERTPALRWLDMLGRRPPGEPGPSDQESRASGPSGQTTAGQTTAGQATAEQAATAARLEPR
jgi:UDP-N-acetylmuramyl pentapeptide phosphotransferase/UDP-N-acetylglucosamine-1-phosphate transferase